MDRYTIDFKGKSYRAVEIDGKCVSDDLYGMDKVRLAEESLDDAIYEVLDTDREARKLDDTIFGFAPAELIEGGSEEELCRYAESLL